MKSEFVNFGNVNNIDEAILLDNIKNVFRKISSAAIRSGRNPFDVKLIAATKTVSPERIKTAVELGLRDIGENRVQEAREKIAYCKANCPDCNIEWHMIGHLQKNKAKNAVELFDLIHSLDSVELADLLNKYAEKAGKIQRVLIEVKLSGEVTKYGVSKENLFTLIEHVYKMPNLKLEGLMTIPPYSENPQLSQPYYRHLRYLQDEADKKGFKLPELSMGMTNDYEIAILEGATMVRIGTGIFGQRKK